MDHEKHYKIHQVHDSIGLRHAYTIIDMYTMSLHIQHIEYTCMGSILKKAVNVEYYKILNPSIDFFSLWTIWI
jgi:hypothetical protein